MRFTKKETNEALNKLIDLKKTFDFGAKMVPVIQSISTFIKEVIPLLKSINFSLSESTAKMPEAADQISNVTSATELATNEILDLIDNSTNSLNEIDQLITKAKDEIIERRATFDELKKHLKGDDKAIELLSKVEESYDLKELGEKVSSTIADINDKNFQVTMSLQVQDITSQQLNAVRDLISNVQGKLTSLIGEIDKTEVSKEFKEFTDKEFDASLPEGQEYNPKASYAKDDRQNQADKIIEESQNDSVSQDDIDKLFS